MPIEYRPIAPRSLSLGECIAQLGPDGFDPDSPQSTTNAVEALAGLALNRGFLGDIALAMLADRSDEGRARNPYTAQSIMLHRPDSNWFLRANIWPAAQDEIVEASGTQSFSYGLPHDHNFDFLTVGYFGPGYRSDYFDYAYDDVAGYPGEPVALRFVEQSALTRGRILHYRAHRDIHRQLPPDSLSVSINIMRMHAAAPWFDQYQFDLDNQRVAGLLSHNASDALLRLAVHLAPDPGRDLAEQFARCHPSERMRFDAVAALAGLLDDAGDRRDAYAQAARRTDSAMVRGAAQARARGIDALLKR